MAPFDELQVLWQNQPEHPAARFDAAATGAFRRYGRRQDLINTAKTILLAAVVIDAAIFMRHRPAILFAVGLMLFSGILALVSEWRHQRAIATLDFSAPSVAFVRDAIARLQAQRNPLHTREYALLFASVLVGYNTIVVVNYGHSSLAERIAGHALGIVLPAAIYVVARWFRARRWEAECRPLVDRLALLLELLEERAR